MKQLKNKLLMISLLTIATITPIFSIGTKKGAQSAQLNRDNHNQGESPWLTIWIHGTRLTPKIFFNKFFHVAPGLAKATDLDASYHHRQIAETLNQLDAQHFNLEHFYLYGWSGKLSFKQRQIAAQELYDKLSKLITDYRAMHGVTPRIRIITHSHGGNVALNLAHCTPENSTFSIDELVLLACPVQEQTKDLIKHSSFKSIVALYSARDMLQVADPQGIFQDDYRENFFDRTWFSERCFPEHPKLKQAQITYNGRGILHVEFLLVQKMCGFIEYLPGILQRLAASNEPLQKIDLNGN